LVLSGLNSLNLYPIDYSSGDNCYLTYTNPASAGESPEITVYDDGC